MHEDVIIIGGGISGLAALHFLKKLRPESRVTLYEKDDRLGGTIGTDHINGYSFDWGPNGFLDREPLTLRLCEEINGNGMLERANEQVQKRFILRKGKLRPVPMKPAAFMLSDILSLKGKLRIMAEPLIPKNNSTDDESIFSFGKRRIGREAADYLIQPMVSGIYGGMAERLSLKACFPVMTEMEKTYGSLFKAMLAKAKKAKSEGKNIGGPSGPTGWLTSFKGGLYSLIQQLEKNYSTHIIKGNGVLSIEKNADYYTVNLEKGAPVSADCVIIATTTYEASRITKSLSVKLSEGFQTIPYAPINVICMGFDEKDIKTKTDGFGFLVPHKENLKILGSIWTSSIFKDRAPQGKVQFRTMVGGDGDHETVKLPDDELTRIVKNEQPKPTGGRRVFLNSKRGILKGLKILKRKSVYLKGCISPVMHIMVSA